MQRIRPDVATRDGVGDSGSANGRPREIAAVATEWFYARNGRQFGPLSSRKIRRLALRGKLKPTDLLWKKGMDQWRPAGESSRLFGPPGPKKPRRQRSQRATAPASAAGQPSADDELADAFDEGLLERLPLGQRPLLAAIAAGVVLGIAAVSVATVILIGIDRMSSDQIPKGMDAPADRTASLGRETGATEPRTEEVVEPQGEPGTSPQGEPGTSPQGEPGTSPEGEPGTQSEGEPQSPPAMAEEVAAPPVGKKSDDDF